jgi:hypothetical protein
MFGMDATPAPDKTLPRDYHRFLPGWELMAKQLKAVSPQTQLINVSDVSQIPETSIPRLSVANFLEQLT